MLTLRTLRQIPTSRTIASFRSVPSRSRPTGAHLTDAGRMGYHRTRIQSEDARRQWLQHQWQGRA
ncbi:hypothetical protein [Leptolyngbya sp. KIOST-1]|uniref:hypothetical protein n=1 Tax=Leptolyngbya sp. KIOST-1 TaxID=1229172 RepID=UPI0005679AF4|nr:hypothetical protein [Leptolyngbya sp. KIOST-1]